MRILLALLVSIVPMFGNCAASWGNGYTYCRAVVIDHTKVANTDQANFPVLVTGTLTYLKTVGNGGKVQSASGFDIIWTSDQQGSTVLKFERNIWSATTGLVEFWFKIPSLSTSVDTTIYLFYGKSGVVVDPADPTNVWDSNYKGVWHFGDGTTLSLADSTSNGNTGTNHSATACAGQINGAACFAQASSQYIDVGNNASLEITSAITVEAWVQYVGAIPLDTTHYPSIVNNISAAGLNGYGMLLHGDSSGGIDQQLYFQTANGGVFRPLSTGSTIVQNNIYSMAGTYNSAAGGANANLYTNVSNRNNAFGASAIGATTENVVFGKASAVGLNQFWDGFLDEIRISNIARSADWLTTGYNNMNSPSTFSTIGNEVQNGGGGGLRINIFR